MVEQRLVLFIYETFFLNDINYVDMDKEYQIDYDFSEKILDPIMIEFLNHFIVDKYNENKELLGVIFNISILEEFINNNYNILDVKNLSKILSKYCGIEKYIELVDSVPKEIDDKINELAINFTNYYNETLELAYKPSNVYQKVLH